MSENKKLIPKRRFKEFQNADAWEQLELGVLGSVAMNKRIFKEQTSESGDIPFYKIGTFGGEADAFISQELFDEYKSKYPYPIIGDLLISASGSIGRIVEYKGKDEYFQDSNIVWLKHDERLVNSFLKQFYSIVRWQGLEGSTIKRLYNKNILETQISLPSPVEQAKIGEFFSTLDSSIAFQQQKLEKMKSMKSAYLSEMFPAEGERKPKRRFPGFTDDWEQCELGELSKITIGEFVIKTKQNPNSEYPVYNGGRSYTGFYDEFNNNENKIVISARGANAGFVNLVRRKYWAGNSCYSVSILDENKVNLDFLFQAIKKKQNLFTDYQQAANIPSVSKKDVELFQISLPVFEEQVKIGKLFKNLDQTITFQQQKLEKLQNIKKAYLNEMFI